MDARRLLSSDATGKLLTRKQTTSAIAKVAEGYAVTVGLGAVETTAEAIEELEKLELLVADLRLLTVDTGLDEGKLKELLGDLSATSTIMPGKEGWEQIQQLLPPLDGLSAVKQKLTSQRLADAHESGALAAVSNGVLALLMSGKGVGEACVRAQESSAEMVAKAIAREKKLKEEEEARRKKRKEEEDARRKARFQDLPKLDMAFTTVPESAFGSTYLAGAATTATLGEMAGYIREVTCSAQGIRGFFRRKASSVETLDVPGGSVGVRWARWHSRDGRNAATNRISNGIAYLLHNGVVPADTCGQVLPGPRGTGKSALLKIAALVAWAFSRWLPRSAVQVVPVVVKCVAAKHIYAALDAEGTKPSFAGILDADPVAVIIDRALQKAGHKPRFEDEVMAGGDGEWLATMTEVEGYLASRNLAVFLVLDEVDELCKVSGRISATLAGMQDSARRVSAWVTASAVFIKSLLYDPANNGEQLKVAGYPHSYEALHDGKWLLMSPLLPMDALEEHAEAAVELGLFESGSAVEESLLDAVRAFQADPRDANARLSLAIQVLVRGSVPRTLVRPAEDDKEQDGTPKKPSDLAKMVLDISKNEAVARGLVTLIKKKLDGVTSENIAKYLARATSSSKLPQLDEYELANAMDGSMEASDASVRLGQHLSSLSYAGVVTQVVERRWRLTSWTAVAAALETAHKFDLSLQARLALGSPEASGSAAFTEAVLSHAVVKGGLQGATVFKASTDARSAEAITAQATEIAEAITTADVPFDNEKLLRTVPMTWETLSVPRLGELVSPSQDNGIDAIVLVPLPPSPQKMVKLNFQYNFTIKLAKDGKVRTLPDADKIVRQGLAHRVLIV